MKKFTALLLALSLIFTLALSFTSCGNKDKSDETTTEDVSTTQEATTSQKDADNNKTEKSTTKDEATTKKETTTKKASTTKATTTASKTVKQPTTNLVIKYHDNSSCNHNWYTTTLYGTEKHCKNGCEYATATINWICPGCNSNNTAPAKAEYYLDGGAAPEDYWAVTCTAEQTCPKCGKWRLEGGFDDHCGGGSLYEINGSGAQSTNVLEYCNQLGKALRTHYANT